MSQKANQTQSRGAHVQKILQYLSQGATPLIARCYAAIVPTNSVTVRPTFAWASSE
jgi:hypothetical protein